MQGSSSSRLARIWLELFFVYIGLVTMVNGVMLARERQTWIVGDWLINYEGGFVRRGLAGEAALLLARLSHLPPVVFAATFFLGLYAVFLLSFRGIALKTSANPWIIALIVSPATISFQVLHRNTGYRKEVLYLAGLTLFVLLLKKGRLSAAGAAVYMAVYVVASTLCHEGLIFYFPYFFAALLLAGRSTAQAARECLVPLAAGVAVFAVCGSHPGTARTVAQICSSLGYKFDPVPGSTRLCEDGAIPYLAGDRAAAGELVLAMVRHYRYLTIFPGFAALALLPAVGESMVLVRARMQREATVLWTAAGASFLGTLVLFRYATDWGRWIYIHVMSITVLLLLIDSMRARAPEDALRPGWGRRTATGVLVFVYATFWILPTDTDTLRLGYAGKVLEKMHILARPANEDRTPSE